MILLRSLSVHFLPGNLLVIFHTPSFVNSLQNLKYVNTLNKYVMSDGTKNV